MCKKYETFARFHLRYKTLKTGQFMHKGLSTYEFCQRKLTKEAVVNNRFNGSAAVLTTTKLSFLLSVKAIRKELSLVEKVTGAKSQKKITH